METNFKMETRYKLDEGKAGDVEIDALTPKQQREIGAKIMAAVDKSIVDILSGGHHVEANSVGTTGTTYEHVRRPRPLLPNSR